MLSLDIIYDFYVLYGLKVAEAYWWIIILVILFSMLYVAGCQRVVSLLKNSNTLRSLTGDRPEPPQVGGICVIIAMMFIFGGWIAGHLGEVTYQDQRQSGFSAYPRVQVHLTVQDFAAGQLSNLDLIDDCQKPGFEKHIPISPFRSLANS